MLFLLLALPPILVFLIEGFIGLRSRRSILASFEAFHVLAKTEGDPAAMSSASACTASSFSFTVSLGGDSRVWGDEWGLCAYE